MGGYIFVNVTCGTNNKTRNTFVSKIEDDSIQIELDKLQNSLNEQSTEPTVEYPTLKSLYSLRNL